jgi:hypothetical protein
MIVIRFQIWFLIKFKLQRREWVWLKLGFSHAKELWHYKYRSQGMKKRRRQLERNPKNRETQKTITKNLKKKLKKIFTKKKGRRTTCWDQPPSPAFFLIFRINQYQCQPVPSLCKYLCHQHQEKRNQLHLLIPVTPPSVELYCMLLTYQTWSSSKQDITKPRDQESCTMDIPSYQQQ